MSLVLKEERPKLKAKRFNKFKPSSDSKTERDYINNIKKRGCKRFFGDDLNYAVKPKRICTTATLNISPPVKNLANNRLSKLKQKIQESLNTEQIDKKNSDNASTKSIFARDTKHRQKVCDKLIKKNTSETENVARELKNLTAKEADVTPLNQSRKNLADERLQNIKRNLNYQNNTKSSSSSKHSNGSKICNSSSQSPQCSSWRRNEDKNNVSLKRNINNVTDTCDYEDNSNYKKFLFKRNLSSSKTVKRTPTSRTEQNNATLKENIVENIFSTNTFTCSTPISKRLVNVKSTNREHGYISQSIEPCKSQSSPAVQKLFDEKDENSVHQSVTLNENSQKNTSNIIVDSSDNFLNKTEMTASWIKIHQDQYKFGTSFRSTDCCLNETKEQNQGGTKSDDETEEMEWTNVSIYPAY